MAQDILLIIVLLLIFGSAAWAVRKSRKSGKKCIGCPDSGCCSGQCGGKKP
ncbi:MAG: FeoB-associated Cys-rich membrane protein [Ruminococcaceae bacterium]|nr:FeoB-associated Cys-rich membrane protein [Oscillospiraceae bacterium]